MAMDNNSGPNSASRSRSGFLYLSSFIEPKNHRHLIPILHHAHAQAFFIYPASSSPRTTATWFGSSQRTLERSPLKSVVKCVTEPESYWSNSASERSQISLWSTLTSKLLMMVCAFFSGLLAVVGGKPHGNPTQEPVKPGFLDFCFEIFSWEGAKRAAFQSEFRKQHPNIFSHSRRHHENFAHTLKVYVHYNRQVTTEGIHAHSVAPLRFCTCVSRVTPKLLAAWAPCIDDVCQETTEGMLENLSKEAFSAEILRVSLSFSVSLSFDFSRRCSKSLTEACPSSRARRNAAVSAAESWRRERARSASWGERACMKHCAAYSCVCVHA
jgi:hypothetical protein